MTTMNINRVLVTGATGFIGSALVKSLNSSSNFEVRGAVRGKTLESDASSITVGDLTQFTDWAPALDGIDVVVHSAARVHIQNDSASDSLDEFRKVNTFGTLNLARQAEEAGVSRFIFLSTIGVNGTRTTDRRYDADSDVAPQSPYAISKHEAELGLLEISRHSRMKVAVIRPPLVYGPDAPGNWGRMVHWLWRGTPLPLGAIHNKRSYVGLDNLVDLVTTCIDHPAATNQIFLVSDGADISTTELLHRVSESLGKKARLFPVPAWLLKLGAYAIGKQESVHRLCGSLQIDISKTRELLNWNPSVRLQDGLQRSAEHFLTSLSMQS